jgi:hypothetical protein
MERDVCKTWQGAINYVVKQEGRMWLLDDLTKHIMTTASKSDEISRNRLILIQTQNVSISSLTAFQLLMPLANVYCLYFHTVIHSLILNQNREIWDQ